MLWNRLPNWPEYAQAARICRVKYQDKVDEIEGPNFLAGGVRYSQIGCKADEGF